MSYRGDELVLELCERHARSFVPDEMKHLYQGPPLLAAGRSSRGDWHE
jgi:hypothetical protein